MSKLCKKIRRVQTWLLLPADIQEARSRADQHVCREEWREYQKERRRQEEEKHNAREKREEEREELKRRQKERPEVATVRLTRHGISVPNIARHFLKDQEREEKAALRDRQAQRKQQERIPRFKHWLGKRSPHLGNLWRFRKRIAPGMEVRKHEFPRVGTLASPYAAYRKMVEKRFPKKMNAAGRTRPLPCTCAVAEGCRRAVQSRAPQGTEPSERIDYGHRVEYGMLPVQRETLISPTFSSCRNRFKKITRKQKRGMHSLKNKKNRDETMLLI